MGNENEGKKNWSFDYAYGENVEKEYPGVNISIERVTPDIARKWLEVNVDNRQKKRETIKQALENDEWILNGATIVFSYDGVLRDGQNRLYAIIESGISADSIVVRGVDPKSQITMDSGVKRTVADFLKMLGYKEPDLVGSIGVALYRSDLGGLESSLYVGSTYQTTTLGTVSFIEEINDTRIEPIRRQSANMARRHKCLRSGTVAPLLDKFRQTGDENMNEFVEQFCGRRQRCQPIQLLVDRFNAIDGDKTADIKKTTAAALIIKAWNAYMQGEEIKQLKFTRGGARPEAFPKIYGLDYQDE